MENNDIILTKKCPMCGSQLTETIDHARCDSVKCQFTRKFKCEKCPYEASIEESFDPSTLPDPDLQIYSWRDIERYQGLEREKLINKVAEWFHDRFYIHPHDNNVIQYVADQPLNDMDDFVELFKQALDEY